MATCLPVLALCVLAPWVPRHAKPGVPTYTAIQLVPIQDDGGNFGAMVVGLDVNSLTHASSPDPGSSGAAPHDQARVIAELSAALVEYRFLLFRGQAIDWQTHLAFAELFGDTFDESRHVNRTPFHGEKDPRVAIFSNDPAHGLINVGVEGFHVDGNVVPLPHRANFLYCEAAIVGGDTMLVPLDELAQDLEFRHADLVRDVSFVSAHVPDVVHPLISPHPVSGKRSMVFGLGTLSDQYKRNGETMSVAETREVMAAIEAAIEKRGFYTHQWAPGDLLIMDNRGVAHRAADATQNRDVGLRIMRRVTLGSVLKPERRRPIHSFPYRCLPGMGGVCFVSLADYLGANAASALTPVSVSDLEREKAAQEGGGVATTARYSGDFLSKEKAREMCKFALHETADLASLLSPHLGSVAGDLVEATKVPHWVAGREMAEDVGIHWPDWNGAAPSDIWPSAPAPDASSGNSSTGAGIVLQKQYPWNVASGQPNDCDGPGSEPCMFVGPSGDWFDFACAPKTAEGTTPGPEVTWSDGVRRMYNVYPLCQVPESLFVDQPKREL